MTIAITDVNLIDMTSDEVKTASTVLITDNQISAVGKTTDIEVPDHATVVEGHSKYLIPGLWDMHVHASRDLDVEYLPLLLGTGVTGIRDMAGDFALTKQFRADTAAGTIDAPRIYAGGRRLGGAQSIDPNSIDASTPEKAVARVQEQAELGVDFIKVYSMIPRDAFFALAEESKRQGFDFVGHSPFAIAAKEASDTGMKSLEHLTSVLFASSADEAGLIEGLMQAIAAGGVGMAILQEIFSFYLSSIHPDEDRCAAVLETMASNETWQTPTILGQDIMANYGLGVFPESDHFKYVSAEVLAGWGPQIDAFFGTMPDVFGAQGTAFIEDRTVVPERLIELLGKINEAGIPIMAGTDARAVYMVPGFSLHEELVLMAKSSMSNYEVLQSATTNPAIFLGIEDDLGTIEEGKTADLLLLDANPLDNIANTQTAHAVIADGKLYDRAALDEVLAAVEGRAQEPEAPIPLPGEMA